jgi:hypothetical protein
VPGTLAYDGKTLALGETGFEIELDCGRYDDIASGAPYHTLSVWADPSESRLPRLTITDAELFGLSVPEDLDGFRIDVDFDGGDEGDHPLPWVRPGSLTGMAKISFNTEEQESTGRWDSSLMYGLDGLSISIDRAGDDLWSIRITARSDDLPVGPVEVEMTVPLTILREDDDG